VGDDTERELLVADVERAGGLVAPQRLRLVPPMLARNFAGDPFFTDGQAPPLCAKMSETVSPPEITVEGERG
jgi:hypothetical protein